MSCWMGRDWHVGVDAELGMYGACVRAGGLGVARADADVDADIMRADIASVDGEKDARADMSDAILYRGIVMRRGRKIGEVSDGFLTGVLVFVYFLFGK